uniref:Uncharacterized protein n=1 Tax=Ralstonia solanacearum TaxID=305 RepID=A0A0S4U134_RALSL|nr:protein of unknown function [Ralstonia solanacearum]
MPGQHEIALSPHAFEPPGTPWRRLLPAGVRIDGEGANTRYGWHGTSGEARLSRRRFRLRPHRSKVR